MSEKPQMFMLEPRRRGRPKGLCEPKMSVSAWIPLAKADALIARANAERISISEFISRAIGQQLNGRRS